MKKKGSPREYILQTLEQKSEISKPPHPPSYSLIRNTEK